MPDPKVPNQPGINESKKDHHESAKGKIPTPDECREQLVVVQEKLKAMGWEDLSPEAMAAVKKTREQKLVTQIEKIERELGRKLSEEGIREIQQRLDDEIKQDEVRYSAKFEKLHRQEEDLLEGIESEKPDIQRAEEYWKKTLEGEVRIEKPINPNCEISIVIPAYNEEPERIFRQIESLEKQHMPPGSFEVIYVINNDVTGNSDRSRAVADTNARVIDLLRQNHGIPIHIIDKSSPGNEIPGCNVGKARNRGVAESSLRFQEINKNGIIIQTDADTWFEDEDYLSKVKTKMESSPDIVGIAGGLNMEWDPDTKDPQERKVLRKKIDRFFLAAMAERFSEFIREPSNFSHFKTSFVGANMIGRSLESAAIGGVPEIKGGEDGKYGEKLEMYAKYKNKSVGSAKHELFLTTAFRESDRTASSIKKRMERIDLDKPTMVPDAFADPNASEPPMVELNQEYVDKLKDAIREKDGGTEFLEDLEQLMKYIRIKGE